jgi:hypothetical protein
MLIPALAVSAPLTDYWRLLMANQGSGGGEYSAILDYSLTDLAMPFDSGSFTNKGTNHLSDPYGAGTPLPAAQLVDGNYAAYFSGTGFLNGDGLDNASWDFRDNVAGDDGRFTIAIWTKMFTAADHMAIGALMYEYQRQWLLWWIYDSSLTGRWRIIIYDSPSYYIYADTAIYLTDTNWHHVAATYDASKTTDGLNLYIDGQNIGTNKVKHASYVKMDMPQPIAFNAGKYRAPQYTYNTAYFKGWLDDYRIYRGTNLTAGAIEALYNAGRIADQPAAP